MKNSVCGKLKFYSICSYFVWAVITLNGNGGKCQNCATSRSVYWILARFSLQFWHIVYYSSHESSRSRCLPLPLGRSFGNGEVGQLRDDNEIDNFIFTLEQLLQANTSNGWCTQLYLSLVLEKWMEMDGASAKCSKGMCTVSTEWQNHSPSPSGEYKKWQTC